MEHLDYSSDTESSGSKFIMNCGSITSESPTTEGWLDNVKGLKTIASNKSLGIPHKKILEAILHQHKKVVVKISDHSETIEKEWEVFQKLKEQSPGLTGIVKYHCYFMCNDSVVDFKPSMPTKSSICHGPGSTLKVLVMEYIKAPSFKRFQWNTVPVEVFRSCCKQVILTMIEGYVSCRFVHDDLHLDNILLKKTKARNLHYPTLGVTLDLRGYAIKLMDLEGATVNEKPIKSLLKDFDKFIKKLNGDMLPFIHTHEIDAMYSKIEDFRDSPPSDARALLSLLENVDRIEYRTHNGGAVDVYIPKKRRVSVGKWGRRSQSPL